MIQIVNLVINRFMCLNILLRINYEAEILNIRFKVGSKVSSYFSNQRDMCP